MLSFLPLSFCHCSDNIIYSSNILYLNLLAATMSSGIKWVGCRELNSKLKGHNLTCYRYTTSNILKWCLYCSYLRCYLSNEVAYFFVVREPNLLFSRGQLLEYQGIEIGSHDRIRTCTTNTLNVPPTANWATWP